MKNQNTKIKALIGLSLLTVGLGGCGDGFNETKLRQAVIDEFKTADVAKLPARTTYSSFAHQTEQCGLRRRWEKTRR